MHWIRRHRRGRPPHPDVLTPAEWRVLEQACEGCSNAEIAERLGIAVPTVKTHMSRILDKLDLPDHRALASWEGQPMVEAPRGAGLAVPLGWMTSKVAGGIATTAVIAVIVVGFIVAMESGQITGGEDAQAPSLAASPSSTPSPEPDSGDLAPTFAPDGRTGVAPLDDLIESLLHDNATELAQRFDGVDAREWFPETGEERTRAPAEWADRLVTSDRALYAVLHGQEQIVPPREVDIVLAVDEGGAEPVGWSFAVEGQRLVDIVIGSGPPSSYATAVERQYDRYLVLPPEDTLPEPPAGHPLDTRTGDADVDLLLALVEAGDDQGLAAAVTYEQQPCGVDVELPCPSGASAGERDALLVRACGGNDTWVTPQSVAMRLGRVTELASTVHGVVDVPDGVHPEAEHLLIVITQVAPYRWESAGLFEDDGRIVGLYTQCYGYPEGMYPPTAFVLPPPEDPASVDPGRTSGLPDVDETLEALRTGNAATLDALVDWEQVGCVAQQDGIGAPPLCEDDETPGTLIDVVSMSSCEGGPVRRGEAIESLLRHGASADWALHSVADIGPPSAQRSFPPGDVEAIFAGPPVDVSVDQTAPAVMALSYTDEGIASVRWGCSISAPETLMTSGRAPSFLLAPPD